MVTDSISGRSARTVRSRYATEMELTREPLPAFPAMYALSGSERASSAEASFHLYGQSATLAKEPATGSASGGSACSRNKGHFTTTLRVRMNSIGGGRRPLPPTRYGPPQSRSANAIQT
jgi:hypothetical protein